jgi:magnesium chelatase accessory protein
VLAAGIRWHVQQAGSGPALLLVHGTGASAHSWRDLLPILAANHTVIAVDLPGHAFTEAVAPARYALAGMGAALAELLTKLGQTPELCVGHSAGAALLCRMALDGLLAPQRIVSLNGAFLPLGGAASVLFAPIAKLFAASPWMSRVIAHRAGAPASVARLIAGTGSTLDARGVDLYARLVREPCHVAGALGMMANWNLLTLERELRGLGTPLTLIAAEHDRAVPPQQAERLGAQLERATLVRVPRLGHLAHEEAPSRFAELILAA